MVKLIEEERCSGSDARADQKKNHSNCFKPKFYIRWSCLRGQIEEWVLGVGCVFPSLHER